MVKSGISNELYLKFLTKNAPYKQFGYFCLMKWYYQLFNFYIKASIHVALAVLCFAHLTSFYLNNPLDKNLSFFLFFATIPSYNFIKYGVEARKFLIVQNSYQQKIQIGSFISFAIACYFAYFLSFETYKCLLVLGVLIAFYALPIFPADRNLRSLGTVKVIIVGLVWTGATLFLPLLETGHNISSDVYIEGVQRFLVILVLMIPFEIRDLHSDYPELKTLPQRFGVYQTRIIGVSMALLFYAVTFLKGTVTEIEWVSKGILLVVLLLLMVRTPEKQTKYFASFWVEAIPIFWIGTLWLVSTFI